MVQRKVKKKKAGKVPCALPIGGDRTAKTEKCGLWVEKNQVSSLKLAEFVKFQKSKMGTPRGSQSG